MFSDTFLSRAVLLSFLLAALPSCSVKEDRSGCPCSLTLEVTGLPVRPVDLVVEGRDYRYALDVAADTVLTLPVPKPDVLVSAVAGAVRSADGSVRIPEGWDCPPVWLFARVVGTSAEETTLRVMPHKAFCRLEMTFSGPPGYGLPFSVEIRGGVDGYLRDGTPSEGPFSCRLVPSADGGCSVRLPRQVDDSLLMQVVFSDRVVRTFALGGYIAASGYDWTAPDLEDLPLLVDISLTAVTLRTARWSETVPLEILI